MPATTLLRNKQKVKKLQWGGTSDRVNLARKTVRNYQLGNPGMTPLSARPNPGIGTIGTPTTMSDAMKSHTITNPAAAEPPKGGNAAGIAQAGSMALGAAGDLVDTFKKDTPLNTWGIKTQTQSSKNSDVASSALKSAGQYAGMGASIGSVIPGIGTAIGAGVGAIAGGIIGLFKGKKKVETEAEDYKDSTQAAYESYNQKSAAQQYAAMARHGAKLTIMKNINRSAKNPIAMKTKSFKIGGKLDKVGEVNIIPSGKLHKENNNLGNKDKGLPVIDKEGKKIFEVEKEELVLRLKTTKEVEDLTAKYQKSHNDAHLISLGKLLEKEIMTNTHDFSGKYGLEV